MNTLKRGSNEPDVILLQSYLGLTPDGAFGPLTESALKDFQSNHSLTVDGICGPKSWKVLQSEFDKPGITEEDYKEAAEYLNVPVATIQAITEVESSGCGFESTRRPRCLFEGHIFWARLKKCSINPELFLDTHTGILYPKWDKTKYLGGEKEWNRLEEAWNIKDSAALESASLGLFQIMGFNYSACGCSDVFEYYSKSFRSEGDQLMLFCKFCESQGLDRYLRDQDWAQFACRYNGPGYAKNKYDQKLEAAFRKYNN